MHLGRARDIFHPATASRCDPRPTLRLFSGDDVLERRRDRTGERTLHLRSVETLSLSSIAYLLNLHASSQHLTLSSVAFEQGVHLTTTRVALSDRASTSTAASADGDGLRAGPLLAANLHPTAALTLSTRHAQHMEWPFWESDVAAVCVSNAGLLFVDPTAQRSTATIRFSHPLRGKLLFAAFLSTVRGGAGLSSKLCVSKLYVSSASRFVEHNR